jgi:alkylresorcinol/alkylpyrone synthase
MLPWEGWVLQEKVDHTRHAEATARFDVEIASVASVVPAHKVSQEVVAETAQRFFPHLTGIASVFANTGIASRYVCEPPEWYYEARGWEERTASFQRNALALLEEATLKAVAAAGIDLEDIGAIVTNTITGLAIPSLEARLVNRLPFSRTVERLPIFGLGCGGGVGGLARAIRIAETMPGGHVLFLTVDLCSLCARGNDMSVANFVSIALFGDGAAAVVLRNTRGGGGGLEGRSRGQIMAIGEHCWPDTEHIMGWDIKDNGFGVVLSPDLPSLMRRELRPALDDFLARNGLELADIKGILLHPGGRRVLDTAQDVLGLSKRDLSHSWDVLREYGNMSSATALFILERALQAGASGPHLLAAFGPGFSAYFIAVDL